jgi:hypothetical protein
MLWIGNNVCQNKIALNLLLLAILSKRRMVDAISIVTFFKKLIKAKKIKIDTS